jgi:hypothetical protein
MNCCLQLPAHTVCIAWQQSVVVQCCGSFNFAACVFAWCFFFFPAGNLLRGGDHRGYNSLAKMYTIDHAMHAGNSTAA